MKHGEEVSLQQREVASKIIGKLCEYYKRNIVAEMLGIQETYVSFAKKMTKRRGENYICPRHVIHKILSSKFLQML